MLWSTSVLSAAQEVPHAHHVPFCAACIWFSERTLARVPRESSDLPAERGSALQRLPARLPTRRHDMQAACTEAWRVPREATAPRAKLAGEC